VVRQAVNRVTPAADGKGIRIQIRMPDSGPICRTDPNRVEQILVNLLGNAIKHSPSGSTVRLSVQAQELVTFTIEDEGNGISAGDVERIFDIYQTKAVEEGQGTGLGLPLSRRLARLLGGELRAIARPGSGGCFILELPLSEE
jgi:signal transduction histidine kinase